MNAAPDLAEADVVVAPAKGAGAVPGGERRRLVEEEQLGETARLHQRGTVPPFEPQPAGDPAFSVVSAADAPGFVVQAAAVPVDEPSSRIGDQIAER